ncbi:MAG: hypothetical protein M0T78_10360 [Actinomycetota bacterium]|nr:hypothetical protein [Actinomycetota bacterium]
MVVADEPWIDDVVNEDVTARSDWRNESIKTSTPISEPQLFEIAPLVDLSELCPFGQTRMNASTDH